MTVNHQSRLGVCVCLPARPAETLPYVWNYVSACRSHHFTTSASPVMMLEKLPGNHLSLSALIPFIVLPFPVSMAAVLAVIFRCTPVLACTALTHTVGLSVHPDYFFQKEPIRTRLDDFTRLILLGGLSQQSVLICDSRLQGICILDNDLSWEDDGVD